jgi:uncharacterized tellurite resistance protein B-like protein
MLESIRQFFEQYLAPPEQDRTNAQPNDGRRLALAACALMLELAHADDEFSDVERRHIEETLERHFALDPKDARELLALADEERRRSVDLYQFTSLITQSYDEGQRMVLAEVLWRLVYADGELAAHESYLLRKLSTLLDLRPGYLAEARKRALGTSPNGDV